MPRKPIELPAEVARAFCDGKALADFGENRQMIKVTATLVLVFVSPIRFADRDAAMQFGKCEMQAIEKMNYQQGDWDGSGGRYLHDPPGETVCL